MRACGMRQAPVLSIFLLCGAIGYADQAADIARIHIEAIGGPARIAALGALRASGYVVTGGKRVRFSLTAARPDRIRLETEAGGRTVVQGSDGVEPPWEFDTGALPPHSRAMAGSVAKTFAADAEFDDPLVAGEARGFVLDYAGEVEVDGRKLLQLLVTRKMTETSYVLLDPDTYLIVQRTEARTSPAGRTLQIVTRYGDFRPVGGVLLPHEISVEIDGRRAQQTKIEAIDANPELASETFTRPKAVSGPARPGKP